jgi:hypothetical protein
MSSEEKEKESVRVPIEIGIPPGTKLLRMHWDEGNSSWRLWIHHDRHFKYGTFLLLSPSGGIDRVTLRPDGTEEVHRVK